MHFDLINDDNVKTMKEMYSEGMQFDYIFSDMMYEDENFKGWIDASFNLLKENAIFTVMTDYHTVAQVKTYLDDLFEVKKHPSHFINWAIYLNEWGGTTRKGFSKKHDDILIYSKGDNWKWYKERIEIPKVTAGTKFDKKGTGLKTPCDVFYDHASFSTMAKERVKLDDHNVPMQKPYWLMERLILPFTDEGDWVLDNFSGSGTTLVWCIRNNRNVIGIEYDKVKCDLALNRIQNMDIDQ
jgi:DNA modification methylase